MRPRHQSPARLLRASLYNVDTLEKRLNLPAEMADRKRETLRAGIHRQALHHRAARQDEERVALDAEDGRRFR